VLIPQRWIFFQKAHPITDTRQMPASKIRFKAKLFRPVESAKTGSWTFLTVPKTTRAKLPSRGMTAIEGTINGFPFQATLEPDGKKSHWFKVDRKLSEAAGAEPGDVVTLEITPAAEESEPTGPADLIKVLAAATPKARALWSDITPIARRDWIHWITSAKQAETRAPDQECLLDARRREATRLLLRPLRVFTEKA
jgi:hypothetical protein